jgi:ATP-dependent DNA helicase RecQ
MRDPLKILTEYWGYTAFRPMQEDIVRSVLRGDDTLALLPTGGGKSICFQVPALCKQGICIVVSPLIALMKDQVQNLRRRNINAEAIYSGLKANDIDRILDNCVHGNVQFLYLSPERLSSNLVRARLAQMQVSLLAIDEAHCISQWGYDFRPPYLQIAEIRTILFNAPVIALTATATPEVVADIQEKLGFRRKNPFQQSFVRDNLAYVVQYVVEKLPKMLDILQKMQGSGIVYVRNRKQTEELAQYLTANGVVAAHYHAGLAAADRTRIQDDWMANKCRIMVATNAFGMGIDKPDVRIVVHIAPPETIEAYFQEAGRAGRDGAKAYAVLLYDKEDRKKLLNDFVVAFPPLLDIRRCYQALGNYFQLAIGSGLGESYDFNLTIFAKKYDFSLLTAHHSLRFLEAAGWIVQSEAAYTPATLQIIVSRDEWYNYLLKNPALEPLLQLLLRAYESIWQMPVKIDERKLYTFLKMPYSKLLTQLEYLHKEQIIAYTPKNDAPQLTYLRERVSQENLTLTESLYEFRKQRHREKMEAMLAYCETADCRSYQLVRYFGEQNAHRCGHCDVCIAQRKALKINAEYEVIQFRILEIIQREAVDAHFLINHFSSTQTDYVLKLLHFLMEQGTVRENEEGILVFCA